MAAEYVPAIVLAKNNNRFQIVHIFPVKKLAIYTFMRRNWKHSSTKMKAKVMMFSYLALMEWKLWPLFSSLDKIVHPLYSVECEYYSFAIPYVFLKIDGYFNYNIFKIYANWLFAVYSSVIPYVFLNLNGYFNLYYCNRKQTSLV